MSKQNDPHAFTLSCDWLQLHVKHDDTFLEKENKYYSFKRIGQSKVFRDMYEIRDLDLDQEIAVYCVNANDNIMSRNSGIMKFNNRELYSHENLKEYVQTVLDRLHLKLMGLTRFDIAFDFLQFNAGCNPEEFIKDYACGKLKKVNACRNSNGGKFFVGGTEKKEGISYESIAFGSKKSNVTTRLYNKTKEMSVNRKPWIDRQHRNVFDMSQDIWRLEFSITSMRAFFKSENLIDKDKEGKDIVLYQGREINYNSLDVLDPVNMYGMFIGLFKKHFRFKINEPGQRLTRMKDVLLWVFDLSFTEMRKIALNPILKQSTRSEKIFIKKLDTLNKEFRLFDENFDWTAKELIGKIIDMHDLYEWAHDHFIDYDRKQKGYIDNVFEFKKMNATND